MNIYALFPLIATITYIPLLITTVRSRPWQNRHKLFTLFLIAAMVWSLTDVFLRSSLFPQLNFFLFQAILITYAWMAVQLHCFTSSFFTPGQRRWLPFAYGSLAVTITLVLVGYIPEGVTANGDKIYLDYGLGIVIIAIPLLTLVTRNIYLFRKRLKILNNPVLYNQIISLVLSISVLTAFTFVSLLPWGKEFPISHFGNIIVAVILSYATIRHQLVDIRLVLRQSLAWIMLGVIGIASYLLLVFGFHFIFSFELDTTATFIATIAAILVALLMYKLRSFLFATIGKAFQRQRYDHRQKLSGFANIIHHVFSLKEQGSELLALVVKAIGCNKAALLFLEPGSEDFVAQLAEPEGMGNPLFGLRLRGDNPVVHHLAKKRRPLTRENLAVLPEFSSLWQQEKESVELSGIELFMPLISRDRLIGILVLDKKKSGRYSLEDFSVLQEVTDRVAVSMEKEYLREKLREREEELSVINRSSAIITSSLDIQGIYDSFIQELKQVVDVNWASISLIEGNELRILALSSEIGSPWQVGERLPLAGTGTEWLAAHKTAMVQPDISQGLKFKTEKYHLIQGLHSIAYIPLIIKSKVIGSLVVASCNTNAYSQKHLNLLQRLATQIAMPIENSLLYAQAEQLARHDELTGLLNRRSMDEVIASETSRHSRYGGVFSLIIFDLDSFKAYNDNLGHLAGDKLLKQIGSTTKQSVRDADQAFRYGGDEFAILLPQTSIETAYEVAERIRKRIADKTKTDHISVTLSLGLASWPADGIEANAIISAADAALYQAKRSGGNQSYCFSKTTPLPEDSISMINQPANKESETLSTIYALAATVDARDNYTRRHSEKVSKYAVAIAKALNLDPLETNKLSTCALLHDIGKIGVGNETLNKRGKLTTEEWEEIKIHPQLGANIVSRVQHLSHCIPGILYHHEKYDGSGYPEGLKGEEIPLEARILSIADAFAAMTSERSFSNDMPYEQALEELKRGAGKQFDPELVKVFLSIIDTIPATTTGETKEKPTSYNIE